MFLASSDKRVEEQNPWLLKWDHAICSRELFSIWKVALGMLLGLGRAWTFNMGKDSKWLEVSIMSWVFLDLPNQASFNSSYHGNITCGIWVHLENTNKFSEWMVQLLVHLSLLHQCLPYGFTDASLWPDDQQRKILGLVHKLVSLICGYFWYAAVLQLHSQMPLKDSGRGMGKSSQWAELRTSHLAFNFIRGGCSSLR